MSAEIADADMRHAAALVTAEPLTIAACRRAWSAEFRAHGIDSPELDARVLIGHALRLDHAALAARADQPLSDEQQRAIGALAARRLAHEPVARITGIKEFWSLPLRVTGATLAPRPETETVVEAVLDALDNKGPRARPWRIADIGTGSGAIALALLAELPNAVAVATDIDAAAVVVARDNARRLGVTRAAYLVCDMVCALRGPFDVIVSNPPYIATADVDRLPPEIRQFDPRRALDGGADGLHYYRVLAAAAAPLLAGNGVLVVEVGKDQGKQVAALIAAAGLAPVALRPDLGGVPRALVGQNVVRDV